MSIISLQQIEPEHGDKDLPAEDEFAANEESPEQLKSLNIEAQRADDYEHQLGILESLKLYKKAVFWSAAFSLTMISDGFDQSILGSFWALPVFRERYGTYYPKLKQYQVPTPWQSGISQASGVGNIFGCLIGAPIVERFGYRRSLICTVTFLIPMLALIVFSPNRPALLAGEILCGIPWGIFSTLSVGYASEVCPISLRGYLTTYINLCQVLGHFIVAAIIQGYSVSRTTEWAYRLPWALQWIWPVPILILLYLAPESPWWLVRKGEYTQAAHSVTRLSSGRASENPQEMVSLMIKTTQLERDVTQGASWIDCFRGSNLRRTEITMIAYACQTFCGLPFASNYTYFFEQAGIPVKDVFKLGLGQEGIATIGTVTSWFLLANFGRRTVYLGGLLTMTTLVLLVGILAIISEKHRQVMWGQAAIMMLWTFTYTFTLGPCAYVVVGETSSSRLRNKSISLGRNFYNITSLSMGILAPYMLNPTAWNWAGKTGFFWAPLSFLCAVWVYFRLPEMKGRSYYELDVLFERKIPARKFATTQVEPEADTHIRRDLGIVVDDLPPAAL